MKAITLRNLPPQLGKTIRKRAQARRTSLNKAVIEILEERAGSRKRNGKKVSRHDLDALAGSWTKREAEEFDRCLALQRAIDPDLWK